jgi:hypothetical protein
MLDKKENLEEKKLEEDLKSFDKRENLERIKRMQNYQRE